MKLINPIKLFVYSFVTVLCISVSTLLFLPALLKEAYGVSNLGNAGSILQGTLGIAVSFSGSVVAIVIAGVTYKVFHAQEERQAADSVNTIIEEATLPIMNVAKQLSALYVTIILLNQEVQEIVDELGGDWREKIRSTERLDRDLLGRTQMADSIDKLALALDAVWGDTYSAFIWNWKNVSDVYLSQSLLIAGRSYDAQRDLPEITNILRVRASAMRREASRPAYSSVLMARLTANIARSRDGNAFNHRGLRDFLQGGAEIWTFPKDGKIQNVGAALLISIARCIPSSEDYNTALSELFSGRLTENLQRQAPMLRSFRKMPPRGWFGHSLASVLDEYEKVKPTLIHT